LIRYRSAKPLLCLCPSQDDTGERKERLRKLIEVLRVVRGRGGDGASGGCDRAIDRHRGGRDNDSRGARAVTGGRGRLGRRARRRRRRGRGLFLFRGGSGWGRRRCISRGRGGMGGVGGGRSGVVCRRRRLLVGGRGVVRPVDKVPVAVNDTCVLACEEREKAGGKIEPVRSGTSRALQQLKLGATARKMHQPRLQW
jgi:hypothetical protein